MEASGNQTEEAYASLKKEIANLNATITFQKMTIDSYIRTLEVLTSNYEDVKRMKEYYQKKAENGKKES